MPIKLRSARHSRTELRFTRVGSRAVVHPKGPHDKALHDFFRWCVEEPGYTVVAVYVPWDTAPEAFEDVAEDLAACPGVLRLIPIRSGNDSTVEFGDWLARRLGRPVVAHDGRATTLPGHGLYVPPGRGEGWLRLQPGGAPMPHSRRFPRPNWDCAPFAEPRGLGPGTALEPLPAGAWIRPAGDSPDVLAFQRWLIGSVPPDPLLPRVVLGHPGSPAPPIAAIAEFWHSLPIALQPAVRFTGFGDADDGTPPFGQLLADALDAPVVLGNGVQLAEPSPAGGYEMRTVLRQGVMSWSPYVGDLGYLPARSTGGVPADPVAIGHHAPIAGLQECEPGVYEYSHDAVLEVTQSGLWIRPPVLPSDSFKVRTEQADPAHAMVVFDASTRASADRMRLLAGELVERLEPRVRSVARILASTAIGTARRTRSTSSVGVMQPPQYAAAPVPTVTAFAGPWAQASVPSGMPDADFASSGTMPISIDTLLAGLASGSQSAAGFGRAPLGGSPFWPSADSESAPQEAANARTLGHEEAPVPPAVALYSLLWNPPPETDRTGWEADLVNRTVAGVRQAPSSGAAADGALAEAWAAVAAMEPGVVTAAAGPAVADPRATAPVGLAGAHEPVPGSPSPQAPPGWHGTDTAQDRTASAPQRVDEPEEPIQYGAFQLVSSGADLAFGGSAAPTPSAPERPRSVAPAAAPARATATVGATAPPPAPAALPHAAEPAPAPPRTQAVEQTRSAAVPAPRQAAKSSEAAKRRPAARPAKAAAVRVQPVPSAQCSVIPRESGLEKERAWVRRNLSKQYDATASSVARILSEHPGLRVGTSASDSDVLTDLVALRLYLTGKIEGLDDAVRAAKVGPHVPLARCVVSGLRRMPSYRGPLRTCALLTGEQVRWYGARSLVTEWSFLPALASAGLDLPGSAEILIWSMSGRRTGLLDPSRTDQVVFQPGTSFKVLSVGGENERPQLRLRELIGTEVGPDGAVQSIAALDEFAVEALEEAGKAWRQEDPVERLPADRQDWFSSPPGLLAHPAAASAAGSSKEGEMA